MGGLAGLYEEFREAILSRGGDDPELAWAPMQSPSGYGFSLSSRKSRNSRSNHSKPERFFKYTTQNLREEITTCRSLISLCNKQEMAIESFYKVHVPRSKSFAYWFDVTKNHIEHKRSAINEHLSQIQGDNTMAVDALDLDIPVRSRMLEYSIKHIVEDELKFHTADRTELINIVDDATWYISDVENTPFVRDGTNAVWVHYVRSHYSLAIRDDHCCSCCGADLFVGIPYCLNCNSLLSR